MTTAAAAVVVVVFAALVASVGFPVFLKKGGGGREERQCYAAGELAQLGQKSPTWLGRRRAAKSQGRHYMYGVRARARARQPTRIVNPISERHYIAVPDVPYIAMTDAREAVSPPMQYT